MSDMRSKTSAASESMDLSKTEVLLIEDDFHTREMVKQVLKQAGVGTIHVAENGREAVDLLLAAHGSIHMAFLDLDMPVMGGFTCLKIIRAAPKEFIADLPVVILTAYAGLPQLEKAAEMGISGFLSKPVSIKTLVEAISKALNGETIDPNLVAGLG